VNWALEVVLLT